MATLDSSPPLAFRVLFLVVSGAALGSALSPLASESRSTAVRVDDPHRLKGSVLPEQYRLVVEPDLDNEVFRGRVEIDVEVVEATNTISLHAEGLANIQVTVTRKGGSEEKIELVVVPRDLFEMIDIVLSENLQVNERYLIALDYEGKLRDDMYGFYVSKYYDNNVEKKLAATHFQATHARKAFPCFDEPGFKARFQVTVITPPGYHCLSNMPVDSESELLMSDFVFNGDGSSEPEEVIFKTWMRPNALEQSKYSLTVSRRMLKVLEEYTGISFIDKTQLPPLDKVDQVAIPDFSAGAMENWGLVTYRETALLYNDGSADAKMFVAIVIAHELSHMWFGNLVTTHWWGATWLNEGFARYFQYYVTDKVEAADWRMWDQFVVDQHQMVFALDSVQMANALTHHVSTPAEASASFGSITYNKGASILRMISNTIGPTYFQQALQNYLHLHKYETVVPQNLFDSLKPYAGAAKLSDDDFDNFLKSWTELPGFPKRFLFKGEGSQLYYVPITWTMEGRSFEIWRPNHYLTPQNPAMDLDGVVWPSERSWVIFNVQETGYYRVNYDARNWNLISTFLNNIDKSISDIHVLNRAQLLDDAFNLARANQLSYEIVFDLAGYLVREYDYIPWSSALTALSHLNLMLGNDIRYPIFKRYGLRLLDRIFDRFNFNVPERHDEKLLLNKIATWACALGHQKCLDTAANMLRLHIEGTSVHPDLRSVVYCYGIHSGNDNYWDIMWEEYKKSQDAVEQGLILAGLGCSSKENRLRTLLEYSISGNAIRKQDASSAFAAVYSNPWGVDVALEFLEANFDSILIQYGSMRAINSILTGIAGRLTKEQQKKKLEAFIQQYQDQLGDAGKSALEAVEENLEWINAHQDGIFTILQNIEYKQHRLPEWVTPLNYTLWLEPNIPQGTFIGEVTIYVVAHAPTDKIILHSQGVHSSNVVVLDRSNRLYENLWQSHTYDENLEFVTLYLRTTLIPNGIYSIDLKFSGTLRDDMYGFYLSTYIDDNGEKTTLAATQFQATYARRAFPCFDEPHFKAQFAVTVRTPAPYHALGNMPVWYTRVWDNYTSEVIFHTTPYMSTYLLAIVVSDFRYLEDKISSNDVVFRTWARRNAIKWAGYSIQVSRPLLEALETITGIAYIDDALEQPFDKVDQQK
ncbi:Aminopeptidase N [Gryllus bimaculatus]|nr:Aminopeptidase N [Gryllus bimaculatus]